MCADSMSASECWCSQKSLGFSYEELYKLQIYMPGVFSCLQKHEWYKHGDCTLFTKEKYFKVAVGIVKEFLKSSFNKYIASNMNKFVTNADIKNNLSENIIKYQTKDFYAFSGCGNDLTKIIIKSFHK